VTGEVKEIRAVARAALVIDALCRHDACSLADLHRATDLPKSTLRRILTTFERTGFVRCSLADRYYRANIGVPWCAASVDNPFISQVVAAATPVLQDLSKKVAWPSDVMVRRGTRLQLVETNRAMTPLKVNRLEIGDQVEMLNTAVGRAYLAFCPANERDDILSGIREFNGAAERKKLAAILSETRRRGYGERDTSFTGSTNQFPWLTDKLFAIAVPALLHHKVICCINLLWPASTRVNDVRSMVKLLESCALKIVDNYVAMSAD
jgi:IclR family mhp operon transcriptional activator